MPEVTLSRDDLRIIKSISKEDTKGRPVFGNLHVERGKIEVADGFMIAMRPSEYDGDEPINIPFTMLREHEKVGAKVEARDGSIVATHYEQAGYSIATNANVPGETYPDVRGSTEPIFKREHIAKVALDPARLKRVLDALPEGCNCVKLYIGNPHDAVLFEGAGEKTTTAALMPVFTTTWRESV